MNPVKVEFNRTQSIHFLNKYFCSLFGLPLHLKDIQEGLLSSRFSNIPCLYISNAGAYAYNLNINGECSTLYKMTIEWIEMQKYTLWKTIYVGIKSEISWFFIFYAVIVVGPYVSIVKYNIFPLSYEYVHLNDVTWIKREKERNRQR